MVRNCARKNPNKWIVVTYHHPLYSASTGRDNTELHNKLKSILDKYAIDLSLKRRNHYNARGHVISLEENIIERINRRDVKLQYVFFQ